MSYILDALRKADAQRERDPARGIHAQAHRPMGTFAERRGARGPAIWGAAAAALAILAAAGWYLYAARNTAAPDRSSRVQIAAVPAMGTGASVTVPAAAAPAPVVGVPAVTAPASPAAPPVATRIEPPAPAIRQVQMPERDPRATSQPPMRGNLQNMPGAAPQPGVTPAAPAGAAAASAAPAGGPVPGSTAAPANGGPVAAPAVAPGNPPPQATAPTPPPVTPPVTAAPAAQAVAGLPPDAPKLAITGGVYSNNRAQRMLIVNGQVFNEGSEIGPGVVLEEIKAKTALLRFRGSRYTVGY